MLHRLVQKGKGPILLEPAQANIRLKNSQPFKVYSLDHDGRLDRPVATAGDGSLAIETGNWKTPYYLIEFE